MKSSGNLFSNPEIYAEMNNRNTVLYKTDCKHYDFLFYFQI
ncbi:hypothetical protein LEP1GSC072_3603 [Leptospira noguchii str. Bonito]|nr:hypothetical protein LEP1GSC072_3603 [Leptospira noguchii str. Bonito]